MLHGGPMNEPTTLPRARGVMRGVNDLIRESLENGGHTTPVAFFCECDDQDCYRSVWLTPTDYADACTDPRWRALSDEHA